MPDLHKLAVILFADIQGYTASMQQDEPTAMLLLNRFKLVVEAEAVQNQGKVVQYFGDGALLSFESAASAVSCAMAMQSAFQAEPYVPVRMGIHLGDVVFKDGNVFGDGVNIASRIESLGVPGAVLMSKTIRNQLKNKPGYQLASLGDFEFKNVEEPMEVFALANEGFVVPKRSEMKGKLKLPSKQGVSNKRNWVLITSAVIAGILAWNLTTFFLSNKAERTPGISSEYKQSIAVLPFRNLSGDSSQIYFSDGMAEEILNALTQLKDLKVSARTSSFKFRGNEVDLEEVGAKLGVKTVLEGSVRRSGNRVRIMANLINIEDESQMWSQRFDRELEDVFEIQDEIAEAISEQLKITLIGDQKKSLIKAPTQNKEAYDLYLKGKHFYDLGQIAQAIEYYELAISLDPDFAPAYAELSQALFFSTQPIGGKLDSETAKKVREMAQKALVLDPGLPEGLIAKVLILHDYENDYPEAERVLKKAIILRPSSSSLYYHLMYNTALQGGDVDSSRMYMEKTLKLDPLDAITYWAPTVFYYYSRNMDGLPKTFQELEKLFPNDFQSTFLRTMIAYFQGEYEKSHEIILPYVPLFESDKFSLGYWYYLRILSQVAPQSAKKKLINFQSDPDWEASDFLQADIYLLLGEKEAFYDHIEAAFQAEEFTGLRYLRILPEYDDLRNEPRFQAFLKRLNDHLPPFDGRGWGIPYLEASR